MIDTIIARRYAKGLSLVALEGDEIVRVRDDMNALADLLDTEEGAYSLPELLDFLASPTVLLESKIKLTDLICEKMDFCKTVSDFLNVLIEKNRVTLSGRIAREYNNLASKMQDTRSAVFESARALKATEEKSLIKAVEAIVDGQVDVRKRVNPRLLGGARVFLDDTLIDGSIAARLEKLKSHLM